MTTQSENANCKSVLVVEDDEDIRNVIVDLLESEGYHTESAGNGQEALDVLHNIQKPCLVLLDMMMPIMDGRAFLDKVMHDSFLAPIPVVVVSAVADKMNTQGAVGYIRKPVDIEVILKLVEKFCEGDSVSFSSKDSAQFHPLV